MANTSIADQLDDAIEIMIAEPNSTPPKVDLKIGDLLGIAAELRLLPDPAFRAALKAELVGQVVVTSPEPIPDPKTAPKPEAILPTLFGVGYGNYPVHSRNIAVSMAIHVALLAMVAASALWLTHPFPKPSVVCILHTDLSLNPLRLPPGMSSGGGARDRQPASKGSLPRLAREQLAPPTVVVPREPPKLAVDMTLVGPPDLSSPQTSQVGNPLSQILGPLSNGRGSGGGIGDGYGGGVGDGTGAYRVGGGVTAPRALYDPDPEYSDEARQAKYQGTVMLWVVVGADGRPRDVRVQRSLGMGLDEKAVQAVRGWKFSPGMKDGAAVDVQVNIEVVFRLF